MARFPFLPRERIFFDLFEESAQNVVKAAGLLTELLNKWDNIEERVKQIRALEHEGDNITHRIIAQLNRTFVTPIDREDIAALANRMDDVVDFIEDAAVSILIYDIDQPRERAKELTDILARATAEVSRAIPCLRHRNQLSHIPEICIEINRLENEADVVLRSGLAELFHDHVDLADVIKWRHIYQQMEIATDRCEDIADVLEGVMIQRA